MSNLSDFVVNARSASICLSSAAATNEPPTVFATGAWTRYGWNGVFYNPYNIITLQPTGLVTMNEVGLYQVLFSMQASNNSASTGAISISTRMRLNDAATIYKWASISHANQTQSYGPGAADFTSAYPRITVPGNTLSIEQRWNNPDNNTRTFRSFFNDGESNIYATLTFLKLRN